MSVLSGSSTVSSVISALETCGLDRMAFRIAYLVLYGMTDNGCLRVHAVLYVLSRCLVIVLSIVRTT